MNLYDHFLNLYARHLAEIKIFIIPLSPPIIYDYGSMKVGNNHKMTTVDFYKLKNQITVV